MQADGIIGSYAIGGAVAAAFYLEPTSTEDVDIFVALEAAPGRLIVTLEPIYEYLKAKGCGVEGQYITVGGWPVQFLGVEGNPLIEEALKNAVEKDVDGIHARVFTPEYLAAIALQLGRTKDKLRLSQFIETKAIQDSLFSKLIERFKLRDKWQQFKRLTE
jgi:hypothetical protein